MLGKLFGKKPSYQFSEPKNQACMTCSHVLDSKAPILFVSHDTDDGGWQFLCGAGTHEVDDGRTISMLEAATLDPTVNALYEMPMGVCAERKTVDGEWRPYRIAEGPNG